MSAADEPEREQAERNDARDAADGPADDRADVARAGGRGSAGREADDRRSVFGDVEDAVRKGGCVSTWLLLRAVEEAGAGAS